MIRLFNGIFGYKQLETTAIYAKTTQEKMDKDLEELNW
ncbi:hypothetical protein DSBG_1971 [Desulfosporosinus sp. BG]|nr:hypothetical protein DSBG_1971 [Desulfosporosinus sp. BG]